jgi:Flavodoxin domain
MKVLIVFESAYGNTRQIAEAIGAGFEDQDEVAVVHVADAVPALLDADLIIVGGPTHVHGLATPTSWRAAVEAAGQDPTLTLEPTACSMHLREWLNELPHARGRAAAFDTRLDAPVLLTGHASATIARRLKRRDYQIIVDPESFLVDHESTLIDGELERARRWGAALAAELHATDVDTANASSDQHPAADVGKVPAAA